MRITDHLRFSKNPDKGDLKLYEKLEKDIGKWISSDSVAAKYISEILNLFHEAFIVEPNAFIKDIFFTNQIMLRATYDRQDYVLAEFKKAKKIKELKTRQIALENIYRSVVADLFDPYLSIMVASAQLNEGCFQSLELANLEKGELNKYEYLNKRLQPNGLLKGYFPIIRNAISHAGSHGVTHDNDQIIFKSIKRGGVPSIKEVKIITTSELSNYIQDLLDMVIAVEAAINIMGLDMKQTIVQSPELARAFQSIITHKQLASTRRKKDHYYNTVWNKNVLTGEAKREFFIRLFVDGCNKNEMPVKNIGFKDQFVIIQIPHKTLDGSADNFLINRVAELINYLLLAEMLFHFQFTDFLVEESAEPSIQSLQLWLKAGELKAYSIGECHILDLMHDGKLFRNKEHQPIIVDFEKLDEMNIQSLKFSGRRKNR